MGIWLALRRQLIIFLTYFLLCSLFLLNHSGGANILFVFLLFIAAATHGLVGLVKVIKGKTWTVDDLLIMLVLFILVIFLVGYYLEFMWWFTSILKGKR
ncbi:hypothetical protein [uncultured Pontibacter sp.]|uniref:hypothetical protein n=1 Tax=uncultured Pontibacter sp. TaxID=453356 RepID=UPI0026022F76|nr:hypothetical protein [uncultured Pontibacter sp.]